MKFIYIIIILLLVIITLQAQKYRLDLKNSAANWTGYGEIGNFSQTGSIPFNEGKVILSKGALISGELEINMLSISSTDKK